jgi:hypothetical protein
MTLPNYADFMGGRFGNWRVACRGEPNRGSGVSTTFPGFSVNPAQRVRRYVVRCITRGFLGQAGRWTRSSRTPFSSPQ